MDESIETRIARADLTYRRLERARAATYRTLYPQKVTPLAAIRILEDIQFQLEGLTMHESADWFKPCSLAGGNIEWALENAKQAEKEREEAANVDV